MTLPVAILAGQVRGYITTEGNIAHQIYQKASHPIFSQSVK